MSEIENIQKNVLLARRELKNIRQEVMKLKAKQKQETEAINSLLLKQNYKEEKEKNIKDSGQNMDYFNMVPIGFITSCFKNKNGIPRQPSLCQTSKASLEISKTYFTNPEHSLIGLNEFPYIWILFVFHKNIESSIKAKVHPPRLNGTSIGVFSTRSPHRPCAIGLSLTKIEKITGNTIFLSGVDMLDGTPVLDIKPYIPSYDIPPLCRNIEYFHDETAPSLDVHKGTRSMESTKGPTCTKPNLNNTVSNICSQNKDSTTDKSVNNKILQNEAIVVDVGELSKMPVNYLQVLFTERAAKDIEKFHSPCQDANCAYCLDFIDSHLAAKQAIVEILENDPRSVYRKNKCSDKLYYFEIDKLHVTCWFDEAIAEVLRVKPLNKDNSSAL